MRYYTLRQYSLRKEADFWQAALEMGKTLAKDLGRARTVEDAVGTVLGKRGKKAYSTFRTIVEGWIKDERGAMGSVGHDAALKDRVLSFLGKHKTETLIGAGAIGGSILGFRIGATLNKKRKRTVINIVNTPERVIESKIVAPQMRRYGNEFV